jgi:tetratricopeptide (TPR) repeat protein
MFNPPTKKTGCRFFSTYESPVKIDVPVNFTPPPFPIIRLLPPGLETNVQLLPADALELAERGAEDRLGDRIFEILQQTQDMEAKKLLALSYGEALLHQGNFDGAYRQLYLLKEQYPKELVGTYAEFLLIHLRAKYQDPNIAEYEYQALESTLGKNSPLMPYLHLGQIEAALASGKYDRLNKLLQRDDVALPGNLQEIVQIRQADYWHAVKQPIKVFAAYHLVSSSTVLRSQPYSLNGYCSSFYDQKKYSDAAACYEQLGEVIPDKSLLGLILYRKNMARLKYEDVSGLIDEFSKIGITYSGSEAGFRANMKKNDLLYLQNSSQARQLLEKYNDIAEASSQRAVREEATFKQALVHWQLGETEQCVEILQGFLREFLFGDVRISAQALMIEVLPGEIKRRIDRKEYVKALALAKQNKDLFENNWINSTFLVDVAKAYHRVGLFDEAQKLYLYLIEITPVGQRETLYLPMIQATFDQGNYSLVEDYASQYLYNYPSGEFRREILLIRLQSLVADHRLPEALRLLPTQLPEDKDFYKIAAAIHFRLEDYKNALDSLNKYSALETPLPSKENFLMAESLYQTGAFSEAETVFRTIPEEHPFYEQSLFRLASLERKNGNEQNALSLFKKIVETGKNPLWKRYAERELQFAELSSRP